MSDDLKELQEVFPLGSKWRVPTGLVRTLAGKSGPNADYEVVGWHESNVVVVDGHSNTAQLPPDAQLEAKRLDVPCPITEPVTLLGCYAARRSNGRNFYLDNDKRPITLHPPGTFAVRQMPEQHGIYTWEAP